MARMDFGREEAGVTFDRRRTMRGYDVVMECVLDVESLVLTTIQAVIVGVVELRPCVRERRAKWPGQDRGCKT